MKEFINNRNPILPVEYHIPDGEGHVMPDGRLYIYGSFDEQGDMFCSEKYFVVSTPDMLHWTIHEEALNGNQVPWFNNPDVPKYQGIDWSRPTPFIQKMLAERKKKGQGNEETVIEKEELPILYAPDCLEKDGKYYLYFCMTDDSEGVAVSDRPEGPFGNPVQLPCGGIDPAIFIDDDGGAYYYWGQLFSHGVKLNQDMVSFDEEKIVHNLVTEKDHFFHEGSSMRKIGDTYYYVYADMERGKPTSLGYSTGKSPLGPFTYRGILIDNDGCDPASWNNHGSIECVNGQWYIFYHRCSRGTEMYRRLCIEPISINADGSIDEVKMTSQGIGDPFAPGEKIMGYQACGLKGSVFIGINEEDMDFPEKLTNISDGDEAVFRYVKSDEPWGEVSITGTGKGIVDLWMNGKKAGRVVINGEKGKKISSSAAVCAPGGKAEVMLKIVQAEDLEIFEFVLDRL